MVAEMGLAGERGKSRGDARPVACVESLNWRIGRGRLDGQSVMVNERISVWFAWNSRAVPISASFHKMISDLREVTGFRGEKILELCLTDYQAFPRPLFRPAFLGDKWPAIDFYVELTSVRRKRLYFFAQAKSTSAALVSSQTDLIISTKKKDIERLLFIPGPTYLFGIHEPSKRVFVRSVHQGVPVQAITRIPLDYELTSGNLQILHDEVREYWTANTHKPNSSSFS